MKIFFSLLFVFFSVAFALAQQGIHAPSKIDSLEKVIATTKVDTVKINALIKASSYWLEHNDLNKSLVLSKQALALAEQKELPESTARAASQLGEIYQARGENARAVFAYEKSLKLWQSLSKNIQIMNLMKALGVINLIMGESTKALDYYFQLLKLAEKTKNLEMIAAGHDGLGTVYEDQKNYSEAIRHQRQALLIYTRLNKKRAIAGVLNNIGMAYYQNGYQTDTALVYYQKALLVLDPILPKGRMEKKFKSNILNNIGAIYEIKKKYPIALTYFQQSYKIVAEIGDSTEMAGALINIGNIYCLTGKYIEGRTLLKQALAVGAKTGNLGLQLYTATNLMNVDSLLGDYRSAYYHARLVMTYRDSLFNDDKAREIGHLEAQYEYHKEEENRQKVQALKDLQEQQRRNQRNFALAGVGLIAAMVIGFMYYRYRTNLQNNRLLQEKNEQLTKNEIALSDANVHLVNLYEEISAQADQLATQRDQLNDAYHHLKDLDEFKEAMSGMIVHDLKNPLSAIIGISNKDHLSHNDQVAIRQAGKQMLNLTLNILDVQKFEQAQVPLNRRDEALTEIVQDAFDQVSLLASNKHQQLSISFEATTGVNADFELISRVLMNLLTNAIKYTPNNGKITIGAEEIPDNQVKISVADTGQGIPADKLDSVFDKFSQVEAKKSGGARSTGLGLTFCKMTVEAHGGRIWVESTVGVGTTFYFTLSKSLAEVKAVQPIILPSNEASEINLTAEDQALLQPFLEKLRALDVYEAGDVLKIIAQIPDTPALSAWKSEMERTIFASNQERFDELVIKN